MCIDRTILKWCLRDVSDMDYYSRDMLRNWTGSSKQNYWSVTGIGDGECVAHLDSFLR